MNRRNIVIVLVLFVIVFPTNPVTSVSAESVKQPGYDLPTYADRYYNSNGELIGAVVNDPTEIGDCLPVNQENSRDLLHNIKLKRSGSDLTALTIDKNGKLIDSRVFSFQDLVNQAGSIDKANALIERIPDFQSGSELNPIDELDWISQPHWEKKYSEEITHQ
ncbi:hypothetical protein EU528_12190 [Candidatus Thorarchaeota archaeon]|nr:MAG: hypothetical protein EU528_12190 [Candidatus Thorarchaeota archaeon]